jgi:hypothetical protein
MRRSPLLLALSLAVAVAPAALAHQGIDEPRPGNDGSELRDHPTPPKAPEAPEAPEAGKGRQGPKGTHHLLHACVVTDATPTGIDVKVLGGNHHMRDVLDGATELAAPIDEHTLIRLVGKARHLHEGSSPARLPKIGTYADLKAGDRVIVRFRAPRAGRVADLPAAFKVIDRGPSDRCTVDEQPPPPPGDGTGGL